MKKQLIYSILSLGLLAACSSIEDENILSNQPVEKHDHALQIEVNASDFTIDGKIVTRAADKGKETVFEVGDKIGVIIVENGTPIAKNNLPYIYDGSQWDFDQETVESEGTGKVLYYNNAAATNVTYIVYYPYNVEANGAKSVDELKSSFAWKSDQSLESAYRYTDLMVWTKTGTPVSKLDVELSHVYSSFSISVNKVCVLDDAEETKLSFETEISEMTVSAGDKTIHPYRAEDGSYRCILEDGFSGDLRWKYIAEGKSYAGSRNVAGIANTRYSRAENINLGKYDFSKAQNGDFYCVNGGKGYLVPKVASNDFLKTVDCVGIVFYVGDVTGDNYGLLDSQYSHGLVSALWEGVDPDDESVEKMTWDYGTSESISDWLATATWADNSRSSDFTSIKGGAKAQGYANTLALREYNASVGDDSPKRNKIVKSLDKFIVSHPLAAGSSEWYCPSEYEAKMLHFGQGLGTGSVGRNNFNQQVAKYKDAKSVGVQIVNAVDYWTSTEVGNNNVLNMNYQDNGWYGTGGSAKNKQYKYRPVLAF